MKNLSKTLRKATSATLAVALTLSLVPACAYAADQYDDATDASAYYYKPVYSLQDAGVMKGYTGTNIFGTWDKLTREQFVTILYRAVNATASGKLHPRFTDASTISDYAYNAMLWAVNEQIVKGVAVSGGNMNLKPQAPITREEIATILYRYVPKSDIPHKAINFADMKDVSSWAKDGVTWAIDRDILRGNNKHLYPTHSANRAETATMFYRSISLIAPDLNINLNPIVHDWQPVYKELDEEVWVENWVTVEIEPAYTEYVVNSIDCVFRDGTTFNSVTDGWDTILAYQRKLLDMGVPSFYTELPHYEPVEHPAVTKQVDKGYYTKTVIDYYKCSITGQTKPA